LEKLNPTILLEYNNDESRTFLMRIRERFNIFQYYTYLRSNWKNAEINFVIKKSIFGYHKIYLEMISTENTLNEDQVILRSYFFHGDFIYILATYCPLIIYKAQSLSVFRGIHQTFKYSNGNNECEIFQKNLFENEKFCDVEFQFENNDEDMVYTVESIGFSFKYPYNFKIDNLFLSKLLHIKIYDSKNIDLEMNNYIGYIQIQSNLNNLNLDDHVKSFTFENYDKINNLKFYDEKNYKIMEFEYNDPETSELIYSWSLIFCVEAYFGRFSIDRKDNKYFEKFKKMAYSFKIDEIYDDNLFFYTDPKNNVLMYFEI
jgi:hypothetical protein